VIYQFIPDLQWLSLTNSGEFRKFLITFHKAITSAAQMQLQGESDPAAEGHDADP